MISYGNRDPNAYYEKAALETAVIFGGMTCEIVPDDDPAYKKCDRKEYPVPHINFMKVSTRRFWLKSFHE